MIIYSIDSNNGHLTVLELMNLGNSYLPMKIVPPNVFQQIESEFENGTRFERNLEDHSPLQA